MKRMIVGVFLGLVLVSLASASFVNFFSNTVDVSIDVSGPVFYTTTGENLVMNSRPDSSSTKTINGIEEVDFIMDKDLGGVDFYKPELSLVVDLEINNLSIARGIELEFGYIKENGNSVRICNVQHIGITDDGEIEVSCNGEVVPKNVKHFYYTVEGMGDEYLEYKIKTRDSYVEVVGVLL